MSQEELTWRKVRQRLKPIQKPLLGFMSGLMLVGNLITPPKQVEAHTGYFLSIIPDANTFSYVPLVVEDGPNADGNHAEFQFLDGYYLFSERGKNWNMKVRLPTTIAEYKAEATGKMGLKGDSIDKLGISEDTKCMYTFPGCNTDGNGWWASITGFVSKFNNDGNGTNEDREAASQVGEALTRSINEALAYITRNLMSDSTYSAVITGDLNQSKKETFINISSLFANYAREAAGAGHSTMTIVGAGGREYDFSIKTLSTTEKKTKGLNPDYQFMHLKAANDNGSGIYFQYNMPRYPAEPGKYKDRGGVSKTLTVFNLIALGNTSLVYGDISISKLDGVYNPSFVEKILTDLLYWALSSLRSLLGLNTMGELIFNSGSYGLTTYYGLAPESWFQAADILFWISQIFAWLLLALGALKFLGNQLWSTVTPFSRMTLMKGIQNIILTALFLTLIVPIFTVVANFNYLIVAVLRDVSTFNDSLVSGHAFPPTLAGIVLGFLFTMSECVINFMYILRGATIAILYGVSPLFVVAFAFGDRYQGITMKFVRELVGNIFIQVFHAIILTFYGLFIFTSGSSGFFVNLVMVFAFIPLTKLFKELTGIGESNFIQGVAQDVHNKSSKMAGNFGKNTLKGAASGVLGGPSEMIGEAIGEKLLNLGNSFGGNSLTTTSGNSSPKTTSTVDQKNLSDAKENRSLGNAVGGDASGGSANSGGSDVSTSTSESSPTATQNPVSFNDGGGNVNEFGAMEVEQNIGNTKKGAFLGTAGSAGVGLGKIAAGGVLGTVGGMTNSKALKSYSRQLSKSGYSNTGKGLKNTWDAGVNMINDPKTKNTFLGKQEVNPDMKGNASAEALRYSGANARKDGILTTVQKTVAGKECLIQEFSQDKAREMELGSINFDDKTGKVLDQAAVDAGITHMSKTEDGKFRVAVDMDKAGIKEFRSSGNGSRFEMTTEIGAGRKDMNYVAGALDRMQSQPQVLDTTKSQPTNSSTDSKTSA